MVLYKGESVALNRHIIVGATLLGFAFSGGAWAGSTKMPGAEDSGWQTCSEAAAEVEVEMGIPAHLLAALSLTETGRSGPARHVESWPWTVHDGKRGHHLGTREEAVELVRKLRSGGRRSIDVGCMQVNLKHHPRAFTSVSEGFDAQVNIRYAATYLKQLKAGYGSWEEAVARYHSHNPAFHENYAIKVLAFWQREKSRAGTNRSQAKTAAGLTAAVQANVRPRPAPNRSAGSMVVAANGRSPVAAGDRVSEAAE